MYIYLPRPQGSVFQISKSRSPFLVHKGAIDTIELYSLQRHQYPVDPVIVRKRNDLNWDDVVNTYEQAIPNSKKGYNEREIFEKFAKKLHLDPLLPSTWYYLVNNQKDIVFPKVSFILFIYFF